MTRLITLFLISVPLAYVLAWIISKLSDQVKLKPRLYFMTLFLLVFASYASLTWSKTPISDGFFWVFLITVALIDFETKTIIDLMIYFGALILLGTKLLTGATLGEQLLGGALGFGTYALIYLIAKWIYKREAFGYGDVLFNGAIGVYLGVQMTLLSSLLTFYVALVVIILSKVIGKIVNSKHEIAFAPYMAIAAFIVSIWGQDILRAYLQAFMR